MFFLGKLNEDSRPLLFCRNQQGDRNAAFHSLKAERNELCSILLKTDSQAREVLASEIFLALGRLKKDDFWVLDSKNPQLLEKGSELVRQAQALEADLKKMAEDLYPHFPGITTLEVAHNLVNYYRIEFTRTRNVVFQQNMDRLQAKICDFEKVKRNAEACCKSDELFQSFVKEGLGKRMSLGCESALLYAQEKGINLRIWRLVNYDVVVPECSNRSSDPTSPFIDLLWHEDQGYCDSLTLQPAKSDSYPSAAVTASRRTAPGEGAPSLYIRNLAYRLIFSPVAAWRREAAVLLNSDLKDTEYLTNILLIALNDTDPFVLRLVDKMLVNLRFDRYKQQKPVSFLINFEEYGINRQNRCIEIRYTIQHKMVSLEQLHKPIPAQADAGPLPSSPLPALNEYSPNILNTLRQAGDTIKWQGGIQMGGATISVGGRTSGLFDNPAGDVPRSLEHAASVPAAVPNNASETRAMNFINSVQRLLTKLTQEDKKNLGIVVNLIWSKVQNDPISLKHAAKLFLALPADIKQKLQNLHPAIHSALISDALKVSAAELLTSSPEQR